MVSYYFRGGGDEGAMKGGASGGSSDFCFLIWMSVYGYVFFLKIH